MIDHFTRAQFESALPCHKTTGEELWGYYGLVDGEHTYTLPGLNNTGIVIRSSVHEDGNSAAKGEDSIRCWLVNDKREPVAPKVARWVTRVPGWQKRLSDTLRYLYKLSYFTRQCADCGTWRKAKRVKKPGPTRGQVFTSCECRGAFEWLPDEFTKRKEKKAA